MRPMKKVICLFQTEPETKKALHGGLNLLGKELGMACNRWCQY